MLGLDLREVRLLSTVACQSTVSRISKDCVCVSVCMCVCVCVCVCVCTFHKVEE